MLFSDTNLEGLLFCGHSIVGKKPRGVWIPAEGNAGDGYDDWAVRKAQMDDRKDHLKLVLAGVGTLVAILLAVLTYQSALRKDWLGFEEAV